MSKFNRMAKYIDIAVNLTDEMFLGIYHGKVKHKGDFNLMIDRSRNAGVTHIMCTSSSCSDILLALDFCKEHGDIVTTAGVHPTRCNLFVEGEDVNNENLKGDDLLNKMKELIKQNPTIVAIGECGLDYDRLEFCSKEVQKEWFCRQIDLAEEFKLPMFLHMRSAGDDFIEIMKENRHRVVGGVVHSFTGTKSELERLLELDLFIGINGCSLKTQENVEVVKHIPLDRLMLETDAPWCGLRPNYAGSKFIKTKIPVKKKERFEEGSCVKDRNEPCFIVQVAEAIAGIQNKDIEEVANAAYNNTIQMFFKDKQ